MTETAAAMLEVLADPGDWAQHYYEYNYTEDGRRISTRCLLGAYGWAAHEDAHWFATLDHSEADPYIIRLAGVIREQYPGRAEICNFLRDVIAQFNDHPDTAFPDVRVVIEKAAQEEM